MLLWEIKFQTHKYVDTGLEHSSTPKMVVCSWRESETVSEVPYLPEAGGLPLLLSFLGLIL